MKLLSFTKNILLIAFSIIFLTTIVFAHPYPAIESLTSRSVYLAERERIPFWNNLNWGTRAPETLLPKSTVVVVAPAPSPTPSPSPTKGSIVTSPATPCGLQLQFKLRTRTVPHNAPYTLMVAGQLFENGKLVCSIYNFVNPASADFDKMVCDPGYTASFQFSTLTGKLYNPTSGEELFQWDKEKGGAWRENEVVVWEWDTGAC